jgi:putative SOS response-associated peptidase YedK
LRWGLLPFWTQELEDSHRLFHARAETLAEKPAFRYALAARRCLIPATGFIEWMERDGVSAPVSFRPREEEFWGFAGLWDEWQGPNGLTIRSCAIVTTQANPLVAPLALRMPAVLRREDEAQWLDPALHDEGRLRALLHPYSTRQTAAFRLDAAGGEALEDVGEETLRSSSAEAERRAAQLYPERRLVRREAVTPDGQVIFKTHSFTRRDDTFWHPVVDVASGGVFCDCPDFRYRHAPHEPDVTMPQHWCKHVMRAVDNCRRHGELRF